MTGSINKLLIATNNIGKLAELREMLLDFPIELISLNDFPDITEVAESGAKFRENARLKAAGYAAQTGMTALADDSGLEVMALDGRPGVLSARYGGPQTSFRSKMALILQELSEASSKNDSREARFVCSMAISDPDGNIVNQADGICSGLIASEPRGTGGFGYDPIFVPHGYEMTFAELPAAIKHEISHRSQAFRLIIPFLQDFMAN